MMKRTDTRTSIRCAVAALLAAVILALVVAAQTPPPPPGRPGPRAARAQAIADLGLTPDQVNALGEFRKARMGERRAFREKTGKLRGERDKIFTPEQLDKIRTFRSGRQGRMGPAGPGRMARPWAYRCRPYPGWHRGWHRW
jgi:Spy/CpxP family protein refolding chaperone